MQRIWREKSRGVGIAHYAFVEEDGDPKILLSLLGWTKPHGVQSVLKEVFDAGDKPVKAQIVDVRVHSICCGNATEEWGTLVVLGASDRQYRVRIGRTKSLSRLVAMNDKFDVLGDEHFAGGRNEYEFRGRKK
jgi:hypothetical protein